MKKLISIGSIINLEKNHHYRTAHTPNYRSLKRHHRLLKMPLSGSINFFFLTRFWENRVSKYFYIVNEMKKFGSLCEHIFCTGLKRKIQFWNFGLLCDHYGSLCEILHRFEILNHYVIIMKWKIHYLAQVSWTGWYIDIGFESLIFLLLKK